MSKYEDSVMDYEYACAIAQNPYFYDMGIEYFRESFKKKFERFPPPMKQHISTQIDSFNIKNINIPIKIYRNNSRPTKQGGEICIAYAHGGGFTVGGFGVVDSLCQDFASDLGVTVIAIDYRVAPEFPHPTAPLDCMAGIQYIRERAAELGINPNKIYLGGESSGGCIAVAVPLLLRDNNLPQIAGVISINPVLNTHRWANRQVHDCSQEYQNEMYFYTSNYLSSSQNVMPEYASPVTVHDVVGFPPAVFFAAKSDPLSTEAEMMHNRLVEAGITSYIHIDEFAVHGSIRARYYYRFARKAYEALLENINKIIGG